MEWLLNRLAAFPNAEPVDVQATLVTLTAGTIAESIARHAPSTRSVYVCGGGAYNGYLLESLDDQIGKAGLEAAVRTTGDLGVPPNHVEAMGFAWLAFRFTQRQAGNLPAVTGAAGPRILGALYPK
jgi:anhydro-N-acetylmuramic acid kinase